ncbi:hypothetical protein LTR62_005982 [Meristemomyces frigidus]|uniref:Sensitive to high expression protein 9, mitochondrial n=1 Tax=Meristemomyces frigidus TaxID=1508187 RepID=A0AAN7YJ92_9PEZI|nr:hypothetical protein LTR62_005982 [Meristemomyces frigidus]
MHPVGRNAVQSAVVSTRVGGSRVGSSAAAWTCLDCRIEAQVRGWKRLHSKSYAARRALSTTARRLEDEQDTGLKKPVIRSTTTAASTKATPEARSTSASTLPSYVEQRRWQFSKDTNQLVNRLIARASLAGQHINVYTGTDYSGIESLRREITAQEQVVRSRYTEVTAAKTAHHDTFVDQSVAQKEIVGLLERKSNWSPFDLERYMSLVRSEHLNDQAVQAAKDTLAAAERELEDARQMLERLERKQYHEEQIWSDTIRRNSTWLTFGLMGVNILLLLAQILVFEPYRRRRIVRDVREALEGKTVHHQAEALLDGEQALLGGGVEKSAVPGAAAVEEIVPAAMSAVNVQAEREPGHVEAVTTPVAADAMLPDQSMDHPQSPSAPLEEPAQPQGSWEMYQTAFRDMFSERLIQIKQVELTTIALQGAATGVAAMGFLVFVLRPK